MAQIYINIKLSADGKHSEVKEHNKEQKLMSMIFFFRILRRTARQNEIWISGYFLGENTFLIENCLHI